MLLLLELLLELLLVLLLLLELLLLLQGCVVVGAASLAIIFGLIFGLSCP